MYVPRPLVAWMVAAVVLADGALGEDCDGNGIDDVDDLNLRALDVAVDSRWPVGLYPQDSAVADVDRDGFGDLLLLERQVGRLSVFPGSIEGVTVPVTFDTAPSSSFAVGDFTGDGEIDAIVVGPLSPFAQFYEGRPGFDFAKAVDVEHGGAGGHVVRSSDFDRDGHLDAIFLNRFEPGVFVIFGSGDGTFAPPQPLVLGEGVRPVSLVVGTMASMPPDAGPWIAVGTQPADSDDALVDSIFFAPRLVRGDRDALLRLDLPALGPTRDFVAGDFDGNETVDFGMAEDSGVALAVYFAEGDGFTRTVALSESPGRVLAADSMDLDGDGDLDIALSSDRPEVVLLTNHGGRRFVEAPPERRQRLEVVPRRVVAGQFDDRESPGVAVTSWNDDLERSEVAILRVETVPSSRDDDRDAQLDRCRDCDTNDVSDGEAFQRGAEDCNRNGVPDDCDFDSRSVLPVLTDRLGVPSALRAAAADFDGDGRQDLFVAVSFSISNPLPVVAFGRGDGSFERPPHLDQSTGRRLITGDWNEDDRPDVAWQQGGALFVAYGRGDGTFDRAVLQPFVGHRVGDVAAGDFDGDGLLDLAGASEESIVIHFGLPGEDFAEPRSLPVEGLSQIEELLVRDFDGNSVDDIGFSSRSAGRVFGSVHFRKDRVSTVNTLRLDEWLAPRPAAIDIDDDGVPELAFVADDPDRGCSVDAVLYARGEDENYVRIKDIRGTRGDRSFLGVEAADIDGDGNQDLLLFRVVDGGPGMGGLHVWFGTGGGQFSTDHFVPIFRPRSVLVASFDGGNRDDVAVVASDGTFEAIDVFRSLERPTLEDCNRNGVPDSCEVADPEVDCDRNGIPDECERSFSDVNENGLSDECETTGFKYLVEGRRALRGPPGSSLTGTYDLVMEPQSARIGGLGAQGWALSIAAFGIDIESITTDGTAGADQFEFPTVGVRNGGFEKSELASAGAVRGAVSSVVLSMTQPITLPVDRPSPVARISVRATAPVGGDLSATLRYFDGLTGTGQSVRNVTTRNGQSVIPFLGMRRVTLSSQPAIFRRGEANGDGRVDISDAIFILDWLFLGGPAPPCEKAADADDSGAHNLSDAVSIASWLFLGGSSLPAPGPTRCGRDDTGDTLGCASIEPCGG